MLVTHCSYFYFYRLLVCYTTFHYPVLFSIHARCCGRATTGRGTSCTGFYKVVRGVLGCRLLGVWVAACELGWLLFASAGQDLCLCASFEMWPSSNKSHCACVLSDQRRHRRPRLLCLSTRRPKQNQTHNSAYCAHYHVFAHYRLP